MAGSLFPAFDMPELSEGGQQYDTRYKRSVRWDYESGDFAMDGANRMVECDGREAFMTWCFKVCQTERYTCPAYPASIGVEMDAATADGDRKVVESMVKRTITDALKVNPRTESVGGFSFGWNGDEMHCSFEVKGTGWDDKFRITI